MAAEEEEVRIEVDAVQMMYGGDCHVIQDFPPHLSVHIRPNTAEDSSQQFVEAIIGIKASIQYPNELPDIYFIETKGLDAKRQTYLLNKMNETAQELAFQSMFIALCEEAVHTISNMNHPDGDCPLCFYPLFPQNNNNENNDLNLNLNLNSPSFMKLMSCYHCFHRECIIRWWKWLHDQNNGQEGSQVNEKNRANCPVCRKEFDKKDIEHVLDFINATNNIEVDEGNNINSEEEKEVLESESEINRRKKIEELLKIQKEKNGLIEPKKDLVVLPGMYISLPTNNNNNNNNNEENQDDNNNNEEDKEEKSGANEIAPPQQHKNRNNRRKHERKYGYNKKENGVRQHWVQKGDTSKQ